jgi:hypothetical protein
MSSRPNVISDYSNLDQTANTFAVAPTLRNAIFEFYLPLPNGRITYTELDSLEIARLLNNRIDLSHVPDDQLPRHHNIQSFIQQQFLQQPIDYQQNNVQQQYFDIQPTQVYSHDHNTASIPTNETISDDIREVNNKNFYE